MNSKKNKNKNRSSKPSTPTPQKDNVVDSETAAEQCEDPLKSEARVPEIVSEVVPPVEGKVSEDDAPKKPKRNRGKKKKGDKESEESQDKSVERPVEINQPMKIEVPESSAQNPTLTQEPPVTPAARKKKNKNKKQAETHQDINVGPIENKQEFMTDLKIINLVQVEGEESKGAKKKNKKKKRHDSERSEKAEEVISCTAAFQKLLEVRDDKKEIKKDASEVSSETKEDAQNKIEIKDDVMELDEPFDKPKEGKNKKKKKDKKHPPGSDVDERSKEIQKESKIKIVTETNEPEQKIREKETPQIKSEGKPISIQNEPLKTVNVTVESIVQEEISPKSEKEGKQIQDSPVLENEKSPKPKAKIGKPVKPVEKKENVKSESENKEVGPTSPVIEKAATSNTKETVDNATLDISEPPKSLGSIPEPIKEADTIPQEMKSQEEQIVTKEECDTMQIPDNKGKKKGKKSPNQKPPRNVPAEVEDCTGKAENKTADSKEAEKFEHSIAAEPSDPQILMEVTKPTEPDESKTKITIGQAIKEPEIKKEKSSEKIVHEKHEHDTTDKTEKPDTKDLQQETAQEKIQPILLKQDNIMKQEEKLIKENVPLSSSPILPSQPPAPAETKIEVFETIQQSEQNPEKEAIEAPSAEKKEQIPLPETGSRKKRKKSPKPTPAPSSKESSVKITEPSETKTGKVHTIEQTESIKPDSEASKSTTESTPAVEKEQISLPPNQSERNRKKSPKPEKRKSPEKRSKSEEQKTAIDETKTKNSLEDNKDKRDSLEMPQLEEIEIRSVKAEESDGSICDIVPDIHHPRATSLDNNNNMVIQEITAADEGKLNIPLSMPNVPIIQGSGETPTPGDITTKMTITELIDLKPEEKTTLKSKVIEVNKDMEDLRKSIEKSLAELTAIEKSEKDAEKQFDDAQAKIEAIKQLASQQTPCEKKEQTDNKKEETTTKPKFEQPPKKDESQQLEPQKPISSDITKVVENVPHPAKVQELKTQPVADTSKDETKSMLEAQKPAETIPVSEQPPPPPPRKDNKGKGKKGKKGKQETNQSAATSTPSTTGSTSTPTTSSANDSKETKQDSGKNDGKTEQKNKDGEEKGKQQSNFYDEDSRTEPKDLEIDELVSGGFEPIESFEDALASNDASEDVNRTFEMIANEANPINTQKNPDINITAPVEDDEKKDGNDKINPVSQPKNLLGHPNIPARLNRTDYKKEKNKAPNNRQAKVKIKDANSIEVNKESKESQTENKRFLKDKTVIEAVSSVTNDKEEYIYKYSFRRVFLPSACHTCKKDLKFGRSPCNFCNLVFYCGPKHRDEDYPQHQALCFSVSTISHIKDQKYIYADAKGITGQDYRLLRMQMIMSCEKVLKRRLVPWEQEALLYPRICADVDCREWRQGKLKDCEGCGQVSYCSDIPEHLPKTHQRWCRSYELYQKLVTYQQTKGRLEPKLPTKVMTEDYQIPGKMNEVLANMYEEQIDMNDILYAALTQIATAPLTAAYGQQLYTEQVRQSNANGVVKKSTFTLHVVGAELQFEADALNKWEVFFLHLRPDIKDLKVVLIGPDLNPSNLPLDLLAKIKLCENCRKNNRRVIFDFQDKKTYPEYWSTDFTTPDLVCAFNPSIQRSSVYNGKDTWPATIKCITKQKVPLVVTAYTLNELNRDLDRVKSCSEVDVKIVSEPQFNPFASVRPDRNFISDDEIPLLFKNFCYTVVCGAF